MKTFKGIRFDNDDTRVTVDDEILSYAVSNTDAPELYFDWGFEGGGAADLAYTILENTTGLVSVAESLHKTYLHDVIAAINDDAWEIPEPDVITWLHTMNEEQDIPELSVWLQENDRRTAKVYGANIVKRAKEELHLSSYEKLAELLGYGYDAVSKAARSGVVSKAMHRAVELLLENKELKEQLHTCDELKTILKRMID